MPREGPGSPRGSADSWPASGLRKRAADAETGLAVVTSEKTFLSRWAGPGPGRTTRRQVSWLADHRPRSVFPASPEGCASDIGASGLPAYSCGHSAGIARRRTGFPLSSGRIRARSTVCAVPCVGRACLSSSVRRQAGLAQRSTPCRAAVRPRDRLRPYNSRHIGTGDAIIRAA